VKNNKKIKKNNHKWWNYGIKFTFYKCSRIWYKGKVKRNEKGDDNEIGSIGKINTITRHNKEWQWWYKLI